MILGFTGTKVGMTAAQKAGVAVVLTYAQPVLVVHGDCVGADDDFDVIAAGLGIPRELYPSDATSYRAQGDMKRPGAWLHTPAPPLRRNTRIVGRSDAMLACPKGPEERRSGTWSTVRLAMKAGKIVTVIWPDGSVTRR